MSGVQQVTRVSALFILAFIYLPLVVITIFSFNDSRHGVSWKGFTLEWYRSLAQNEAAQNALKNSLVVAICSTSIATVLGSMLGYGMERHSFKGKGMLARLLQLPICIPDIVFAVALLLFYSIVRYWTGYMQLGLGTMILAHATFQIPFVAMVVGGRLKGLDPSLDEAARDLGASAWQRIWHVNLPLLRPGIIAGALLAFTLSLDDFVVSFFTAGAGSTTIPILIYSSVKRGITPEIHAISTLMLAASAVAAAIVILVQRRFTQQMEKR